MKQTKCIKASGILFLLLLFSFSAFGQTITVQGTVKDLANSPLIGVSIKLQGSTTGTITDIDGKYSIKATSASKLIYSYVGYKPQTISVDGKTTINVVLEEDTKLIDEVVVIGYGTAKKSDLTGAVASANIKDFEKSPNTNIIQSLQGVVPGLNIGQITKAGETPSIQIRGTNTIAGNTSVLVVIDGIVSGNLSSINPADIESVNILKDASSTAIYGAAASNGVMLITTKKGKTGKAKINLSSSYSIQNPTHNYATMNREQYLAFVKNLVYEESYTAASGYTEENPSFKLYTQLPETYMKDAEGNITTTDFNWWDACTQQASINENKISISGGTEAISYLVSFGNTNQKNFLINDNFQRNSVRVNLDANVRSWWKLGVQSSGSFVNQDGSECSLWELYSMNPLTSAYKADGTINPAPMEMARNNPLNGSDVDDRERHTYFVGNVYSEFKLPIKGLTYRINYGNNLTINTHYQSNPYGNSITGDVYKEFSTVYNYTIDNILNYTKDFGLHSVGATLVYGIGEDEYSYTKANATVFTDLTLGYNSLELGTNKFVYSDANSSSSLYQVGRINYKYNNRYMLTATIRRDGFSGFAANHKTAIFPSAALGWVASEEDFFKNALPVVNYLKVRVGYGATGNKPYDKTTYLSSYTSLAKVSTSSGYIFGDGSTAVIRQELYSMENKDLKWEKTGGLNIGLDFHLLTDRIVGSVDAYQTKTTDLLFDVSIPTITGFSSIRSNVGNLQNKGIELTLTTRNIVTRNFEWSTTFNISSNKNKVLSLLGTDGDGDGKEDDLVTSGLFIGKSLGAVYGYIVDGIYGVDDEIPSGYYLGNYKIRDINGLDANGKLTGEPDGKISTADRTIIGSTDPAYRFSIMNKFNYKNFAFSFFINSVQGGKDGYLGENTYNLLRDNTAKACNHLNEFSKNVWSPVNTDGIYSSSKTAGAITPYRYEQRNFIRLQDVTFSYNLPKSLISRIGLENVNLYVTGKNLLTLTDWHGWDPEANYGTIKPMYNLSASKDINKSGSDYDSRPVMKSFTFGIDVSF
ncbi:MAG: SusC/RagA family TonB-linked outer membrane protein [Bacteroidetes bacterium]|nr:SusC/RagA family TonB-linked outer membrane protein [Bacteroidota bacterium]